MSLGDVIRITCPQAHSLHVLVSVLNVVTGDMHFKITCTQTQTDVAQYKNCSCDAIAEGCAANQLLAQTCSPALRATVTILRTLLPSVFDYVPGQTYYFTCKLGHG